MFTLSIASSNFIREIYLILCFFFLFTLVGRLPSEFMLFILTFGFITNGNNNARAHTHTRSLTDHTN